MKIEEMGGDLVEEILRSDSAIINAHGTDHIIRHTTGDNTQRKSRGTPGGVP